MDPRLKGFSPATCNPWLLLALLDRNIGPIQVVRPGRAGDPKAQEFELACPACGSGRVRLDFRWARQPERVRSSCSCSAQEINTALDLDIDELSKPIPFRNINSLIFKHPFENV